MRFYRVNYSINYGSSAGYTWHATHRAARKASDDYVRENPDETAPIDLVTIESTKTGILRALFTYASHPNNG